MTPRTCLAIAAVLAAAGALPAAAQTSLKSGDGYVYAPTTLGSRNPQPYVAEPTASAASGLEAPAERLGSIVEALNAEATLKGSKLTVGPENEEVVILTGVTVTRDQMKRAMEIAASQAGEGKVINAITSEELVITAAPAPAS
jgi:hypothetical protein